MKKKDGVHYSRKFHRFEVWRFGEMVYWKGISPDTAFLETFNEVLNVGVQAYGLNVSLTIGTQETTI